MTASNLVGQRVSGAAGSAAVEAHAGAPQSAPSRAEFAHSPDNCQLWKLYKMPECGPKAQSRRDVLGNCENPAGFALT